MPNSGGPADAGPAPVFHRLLPNLLTLPEGGARAAAWVFPGQGAQQVGMGKELFDSSAAARGIFEEADEVLGRPLSRLCFEGPEEKLRQTENAQPAIMAVSLACLGAASEQGRLEALTPGFVAGHSLGEYTAAVAAGALSLADGLRLVQERGRLMQRAGEERPGTMAALLGPDEDAVRKLCEETGVEVANVNAPGQIVVGGSVEAVERAVERARDFGARRALRLNVSGAFHTTLMGPANEGMAKALAAAAIRDPAVPIAANGTGTALRTGRELREELLYQLNHPVQWQRSVAMMAAQGVVTFVEFGPGEVLAGLVRRTVAEAQTLNFGAGGVSSA